MLAPPQTTTLFWVWWLVELTPQVPQRLLGTYIGVLHSSNLCACSSTNHHAHQNSAVVCGGASTEVRTVQHTYVSPQQSLWYMWSELH